MKKLNLPLSKDDISCLSAGDYVLLSGKILTARDSAHKRLMNLIEEGKPLPVQLENQIIYYVGACFDKNNKPTSAGPTTSMRMDSFAPTFYQKGLVATIGKGDRGTAVYNAITKYNALYFVAIGGAGAIYGNAIKNSKLLAYEDLQSEGIYEFDVIDFPLIVAIDSKGNSIF